MSDSVIIRMVFLNAQTREYIIYSPPDFEKLYSVFIHFLAINIFMTRVPHTLKMKEEKTIYTHVKSMIHTCTAPPNMIRGVAVGMLCVLIPLPYIPLVPLLHIFLAMQ